MKRSIFFALLFLLHLPLLAAQKSRVVTFATLLEEMSNRQSLAQWNYNSNYKLVQASSYSRESTSSVTAIEDGAFRPQSGRDWGKGWFENHDFGQFIRQEVNSNRNELVMMEDYGAGAIVRFWATFGGVPDEIGGLYRIYIDGDKEPTITLKNKNLVENNGMVGEPFAFYAPKESENPTWRGLNFLLPIPYAQSCKITYEPFEDDSDGWNGHYYAINYRRYDDRVVVESFDKNTINKYSKDLACYAHILEQRESVVTGMLTSKQGSIAAGEQMQINLEGQKAITTLRCNIDAKDIEQALRSTVLEITFDDMKTVWCPVGQFYGVGYRKLNNKTFYISADSLGAMEAKWVMPFSKTAKVVLHNYGEQSIRVNAFDVVHEDYKWDKNSMYFHAAWNETKHLESVNKSDYNFIEIEGKGVFVADNLTIYNSYPDKTGINWWGEGDEKIYVDGESFPSHFGTGTEDYYSYAWCRPQWFSSISVSQPLGEGNKTPGLSVNNRYRLLDAIPFDSSLKFDMEIWHPYYSKMNYSPATFWYAFAGAQWNYKDNVAEVKKPVARKVSDVDNSIEKVKVFIVAGQSNAVGYNHIDQMGDKKQDLLSKIAATKGDVLFWAGTNAKQGAGVWQDLKVGVSDISTENGYKDGCFGIEVGIALSLQQKYKGEKIAIIKYAVGGTGIAPSQDYNDFIPALKDFDSGERIWYPGTHNRESGQLYKELVSNINAALNSLETNNMTYEICGMFWMQGEHEAGISKQMAQDYDLLLDMFRRSIRKDIGSHELPFVMGEINSHTWAFREIGVRNQIKASQIDPNSAIAKSADLERGGIGGASHFVAPAMVTLGERMAQEYFKLLDSTAAKNN